MELLQLLKAHPFPHIVLLDIHMPIMDGFETYNQLKILYPQLKVIFLTMNNDISLIHRSKELGISGFLTKAASCEEIISAIMEVAKGNLYFPGLKRKDYLV